MKLPLAPLLALCVAGCALPGSHASVPPGRPISPLGVWDSPARHLAAVQRHRAFLAAREAEAFDRYLVGDVPGESEEERAAFRRVCREHQTEREIVLDDLRENAREHAKARADWFRTNCTPAAAPAGTISYVVVDRETGTVATADDLGDALNVCLASAGMPPPRFYERTAIEIMAQVRRDTCEMAQ